MKISNDNPISKLDKEIIKYKSEDVKMLGNIFRELDMEILYNKVPEKGWINKIRTTISMSLKQLAARLEVPVSPSAIKDFERHEADGTITLNSMRKIAKAMNMKFTYRFEPSVSQMVESAAYAAARQFYYKEENKIDFSNISPSKMNEKEEEIIQKKKIEIITKNLKSLWD